MSLPPLDSKAVATSTERVCAVVVTFHPGADLERNLRAMMDECEAVIVVDNGSGPEVCARIAAIPGLYLIGLPDNRGVAAALNCGAQRAAGLGFQWIVTFDQDSRPQPGFLPALLGTHVRWPNAAVIGAHIDEAALIRSYRWLRPRARFRFWFERVPCESADLPDVTVVVTSGALTELACWAAVGGFDEGLFIDFVDTDFCLRCRAAGRTVAVSATAHLVHRLGRRETRRLGGLTFHPTHHNALRHYYIARNRVRMIGRHAWREPHWLFFEMGVAGLWLFRVLAFEGEKIPKIRAMLLGTLDGFLGRSGACHPARARALDR